MTWDQLAGGWTQYKRELKAMWRKLTDDDLNAIDGQRDMLVGKLQEYYGTTKAMAEKAADEFVSFLAADDEDEDGHAAAVR